VFPADFRGVRKPNNLQPVQDNPLKTRGNKPLFSADREVVCVKFSESAMAAADWLRAAIVAARAEAPGSAVHQPGLPPVPALEAPVPADVGSVTETPARADRAEAAPDADDIVERAWRELMSRLAIEQERRGFGRWA